MPEPRDEHDDDGAIEALAAVIAGEAVRRMSARTDRAGNAIGPFTNESKVAGDTPAGAERGSLPNEQSENN